LPGKPACVSFQRRRFCGDGIPWNPFDLYSDHLDPSILGDEFILLDVAKTRFDLLSMFSAAVVDYAIHWSEIPRIV
jgi:hypothetical protein